jgi:general secretion pathway protein K
MIVTLWTITLMTILVAVLASQSRLSAQVARAQQQEVANWAALESAVNQAEMDVLLQRMPPPAEDAERFDSFSDSLAALGRTPLYRFDGSPLALYYPQQEGIEVRLYDHAGKINLQSLSRPKLRALLERKLGGPRNADQRQIDDMMEAWNDWLDLNDGASANGAERDYYQSLPQPYLPRNGALESVEELLHVRGFAEVFADVNLDAAFTVYGDDDLINLNLATVDAMRLLPGLDDALIADILRYRAEKEFLGNGDVAQVVPAENMAELRPWLNSRKQTDYYSLLVRTSALPSTAYAEIIHVFSPTDRPRVLKINPYQTLPLLEPADRGEDALP